VDEPCTETLELTVTMISTLFVATHVSILTSDISNKIHILSSTTYRTFCYQDFKIFRSFGGLLKPRYIFGAKRLV